MKKLVLFLIFAGASPTFASQAAKNPEAVRWEQEAQNVTITRDDWGIAHVYGKTDTDAVFGMIYAQAEDDFNRVETNYINAMGRLAEAEGESKIYQDLRMKLFINPVELKKLYGESPASLKALGGDCHVTGDTARAVFPEESQDMALEALRREGLRLISLVPVRTTLEEYFVEKLRKPERTAGAIA